MHDTVRPLPRPGRQTAPRGKRVLIAEDEEAFVDLARRALSPRFELMSCPSAAEAATALRDWRPALILLDLTLADGDGRRLLSGAQAALGNEVPFIIFTTEEPCRAMAECFRLGAADFVNKPWPDGELEARVEKALRPRTPVGHEFVHGPLRLDPDRSEVSLHGKPLSVGRHAFAFLVKLLERPGSVVTREDLLDSLWSRSEIPGCKCDFSVLKTMVSRLRKAMGQDAELIETLDGVGFRLRGLSR